MIIDSKSVTYLCPEQTELELPEIEIFMHTFDVICVEKSS